MSEEAGIHQNFDEILSSFLASYARELDFYRELARITADRCRSLLKVSGIKAMITHREKDISGLRIKVEQRNAIKLYKDPDHIRRDIADLAGVRIALYFPKDRTKVESLIQDNFQSLDEIRKFPSLDRKDDGKKFTGYHATHLRVCLGSNEENPNYTRYASAQVEIQVGSVLMHAWAEVEHDLAYKPSGSGLSEEEFDILDELNGLVLAGEIALTRLQRAAERSRAQQSAAERSRAQQSAESNRNIARLKTSTNLAFIFIKF